VSERVLINPALVPEDQRAMAEAVNKMPDLPEAISSDGWRMVIDPKNQLVTVSDGCDSILLMAHELVPFALALLKAIFENKWYGDA
jgi:hypothetical protein